MKGEKRGVCCVCGAAVVLIRNPERANAFRQDMTLRAINSEEDRYLIAEHCQSYGLECSGSGQLPL